MIPARLGSQRLKQKNLQCIGDDSLLRIAVKKAISSGCFDEIYVNTESTLLWNEISDLGVHWYKRNDELADNNATSEDFVFDFLTNIDCDYMVQLHSIAPLLKLSTIKDFVKVLRSRDVGSVFSVDEVILETVYEKGPVNFSWSKKTNSQDLKPLQRINWALTAWSRVKFLEQKQKGKSATYVVPRVFHSMQSFEALMVKTQYDLDICRVLYDVVHR